MYLQLLLYSIEYNYNEIEGGIEMEEQKNIPDEYKRISYFCVLIILLIIVGFFALFTGAILSSKALQTIIY